MIEINCVNRDAFCWAVKSAMRVTRKRSNVKKAVRICKVVVAPTIKWVLNDNLCLLYAIWEMCTAAQKNILTVSQCMKLPLSNIYDMDITDCVNITLVDGR